MSNNSILIHDPSYYDYFFGSDHPFNPMRLHMTFDLLQKMNLVLPDQIRKPEPISDALLATVHTQEYIDAIKQASNDPNFSSTKFGIGTEDTPVFANMHSITSLIAAGTVKAADLVMEGTCDHALNLAGGLHHAFANQASGFCVYNDVAIAIKHIQQKYDVKVLYIDTDAHHGDGVQSIFYNDPSVLTVSFHETGKYLFPGTGHIHERGREDGYGYAYNIPLEPFTEDDSFKAVLEEVLPEVVQSFKPDLLITQNGCDAHYLDPLTHLYSTINIFAEIPKLVHQLAHTFCNGKWVAVGGGGYDIWRVVPRAWTLLWAEMNQIPGILDATIPPEWTERWSADAPVQLPWRMRDPEQMYEPIPRKGEIDEKNALTAKKALQKI